MTRWAKYIALLPAFVATQIAARLLAPFAVVFFSTPDRTHLRAPFRWLETTDADLGGDRYWPSHITGDRYSTKNRILWLLRNGGHRLAYGAFGCAVTDPHPLFREFYPIPATGSFLELFIGWNMPGPIDGRCKYVMSIRLTKSAKP